MERPKEFMGERRNVTVNGNELTAHLAAVLSHQLERDGIATKRAESISLDVMEEVRKQYAGQNVYFPHNTKAKTSERDLEIYERHARNELTIPQIVHTYGISIQWAYHILRTVPAKLRKQREDERQAERAKDHERWKREN
jgi:Mor family transcriptional regulator